MFKFLAACTAALMLSGPASAASPLSLANDLGSILASETVCGLTYDQAAITAWIEKEVPADAMDFPGRLQTMTRGYSRQLANMGASEKTAHCSAVKRIASNFGFTS
ncbi:hypothetical protein [Haematobacter massiliensis]|uniref:hypothetical protein n=1 Tax=Haematobacter massiliensis TaxID=195105 RepID=UPI0023F2D74E|nr:hypothetical protein [Haematobacter massiliensis]